MSTLKAYKSRSHPLWIAYFIHRVSGLALALFLPMHFWVLAMAVTDKTRMDGFLALTDLVVVKLAEFLLVFFLSVHLFGGLRLMAMEWLPWSGSQKTLAALAFAVSFFIAIMFFLQAI